MSNSIEQPNQDLENFYKWLKELEEKKLLEENDINPEHILKTKAIIQTETENEDGRTVTGLELYKETIDFCRNILASTKSFEEAVELCDKQKEIIEQFRNKIKNDDNFSNIVKSSIKEFAAVLLNELAKTAGIMKKGNNKEKKGLEEVA